MPTRAILVWAIGLLFLAVAGRTHAGTSKEPQADQIAALIRQLGHEKYAKREAASRDLEVIGTPRDCSTSPTE